MRAAGVEACLAAPADLLMRRVRAVNEGAVAQEAPVQEPAVEGPPVEAVVGVAVVIHTAVAVGTAVAAGCEVVAVPAEGEGVAIEEAVGSCTRAE